MVIYTLAALSGAIVGLLLGLFGGGSVLAAPAGRVKRPCALVFGGAGLAGSLVGAHFAKQLAGGTLLIISPGRLRSLRMICGFGSRCFSLPRPRRRSISPTVDLGMPSLWALCTPGSGRLKGAAATLADLGRAYRIENEARRSGGTRAAAGPHLGAGRFRADGARSQGLHDGAPARAAAVL